MASRPVTPTACIVLMPMPLPRPALSQRPPQSPLAARQLPKKTAALRLDALHQAACTRCALTQALNPGLADALRPGAAAKPKPVLLARLVELVLGQPLAQAGGMRPETAF